MVVKIISKSGGKLLGERIYIARIIGIEQFYANNILERLSQTGVLNNIRKICKYIKNNDLKAWYAQRLVDNVYIAAGYPIMLRVKLDNGMQISFRLKKSINLDKIAETIFICNGKLELIVDEDESEIVARCYEHRPYVIH